MKIAICGSSASSIHQAPFQDQSWDIWALPLEQRRVSCYFEIHEDKFLRPETDDFFRNKCKVPVVVLRPRPEWPTSTIFPYALFKQHDGYFTSSIAYMLALAIHYQAAEIGLWGVDMATDSEWNHQRPCAQYYIGYARGRGIKVYIPENSALCKANYIYGPENKPKAQGITENYLTARRNEFIKASQEARSDLDKYTGAISELTTIINHLHHFERGGVIPEIKS